MKTDFSEGLGGIGGSNPPKNIYWRDMGISWNNKLIRNHFLASIFP